MMKPIAFTALLGLGVLGACAATNQTATSTAATFSAAQIETAGRTAQGGFEGRSDHVTTGTGSIGRVDGKWVVILEQDFTFDGAPDPKVALGNNGFDSSTILAPLAMNDGKQAYVIPANFDVADYNEIWIWCERFSVPLGVAKLNLI